jgi:diadenosine tetraphosphate (Ap4A) HIT family hydrolase
MELIMSSYDTTNVFAKILRGEIPCKKIKETTHSLAFHDAFPKAPVHALVIPKGQYKNFDDFTKNASSEEIIDFWKTAQEVSNELEMTVSGFRLITNNGYNANQEVPHFHIHLCGGKNLGPMISL